MTTTVAAGKPGMLRRTAAAVALAALVVAVVYLAMSAVSRWYVLLASVVSLGRETTSVVITSLTVCIGIAGLRCSCSVVLSQTVVPRRAPS